MHKEPVTDHNDTTDSLAFCDRTDAVIRAMERRSRALALATTLATVLASAMIPVSLVISSEAGPFLFGKLLPSLLGASAATAATIAQILRPHERWRVFVRWQTALRNERWSYVFGLGDYAGDDRDRILAERVILVRQSMSGDRIALLPSVTAARPGAPEA